MIISFDKAPWASLLVAIGATPSLWQFDGVEGVAAPSWQVVLRTTGLEVAIEDVALDETGLFVYEGQRVLIYIKDTFQAADTLLNDPEKSKRFHFRDCQVIQNMKSARRFQRYVAIAREDGLFPVFSLEEDGTQEAFEAPLRVCKVCLKELNFQDYASQRIGSKKRIWNAFDIPNFFATYPSTIGTLPDDQGSHVTPDAYVDGWSAISLQARADADWTCQGCFVDLAAERHLLHVHHINGVRADNSVANLCVLCLLCHRKEPQHHSMYVEPAGLKLIRDIRKEQGIEVDD